MWTGRGSPRVTRVLTEAPTSTVAYSLVHLRSVTVDSTLADDQHISVTEAGTLVRCHVPQ